MYAIRSYYGKLSRPPRTAADLEPVPAAGGNAVEIEGGKGRTIPVAELVVDLLAA